MTAEAQKATANPIQLRTYLTPANLALIVGFAALAVPTIIGLGQQVWTTELGAHGPIVLAVGAWLLVRGVTAAKPQFAPSSLVLTLVGLMASLALYIFGRAFDFMTFEAAGLYGAGVSLLYSRVGLRAMRTLWFPVGYLAFLIPPPHWVMDQFTAPLKQFVSWAAMSILSAVGIPVSHEGVTIYVGSYRLLVEDACSGMNSLIGLIAVSLLYIYLLRGSKARYAAILTATTIPIAILGNIIRIMTLILLTFFGGDELAQGFLHETAGLFLFAIDLILVFLADQVLARSLPKSWKPA
ncbi:exosortase V [Phenylobacterium sp.]|jgi:exosortase|uniref:exosortase V n=1 Tax=Phenylobacterium sp. TaxID=1871053 RepID=UPI002F4235C9